MINKNPIQKPKPSMDSAMTEMQKVSAPNAGPASTSQYNNSSTKNMSVQFQSSIQNGDGSSKATS